MSGRLVAVTFANGLGNFVMLTPTLYALHEMYDAKIDLYLDNKWQDSRRPPVEMLFSKMEYANSIIPFNKNTFDPDKYSAIYWTSHGEPYEAHTEFRKIADFKATFGGEDENWLHTKEHEIEFYMSPVFENGYRKAIPRQLEGFKRTLWRKHRSPHEYRIKAAGGIRYKLKIGFCNGYFPGPAWNWSRKAWPYFFDLGLMVKSYFGTKSVVYLLGKGDNDRKWANSILRRFKKHEYKVSDFVGKFDIFGTLGTMMELDVLVTTDTGLMHLADAFGIPMVVIFGATIATKNGPFNGTSSRLVQSLRGCAPCQDTPKFHLCENFKCMEDISPANVFGQLLNLLDDLGYMYG